MVKRIFSLVMLLALLWTGTSFAFTEMTPRTLEQNIQKAAQGNKQAKEQVTNLWKQQLSKVDIKEYSFDEALSRMQKLAEQKKIPAYILERGQYKYTKGNNAAYVVGENVFLRSQPNTKARIITKANIKTTTYVTYLGEWKHPSTGEIWVCIKNSSDEIGWIFGKYIQLVPNVTFQNIVSQIKGNPTFSVKEAKSSPTISKSVVPSTSLKIVSIDNHLNKTLKRYTIYGLIVWALSFGITFLILNWEINLDHVLRFAFWSIATLVIVVIAYVFLYYILWKGIILPILKYIAAFIAGILFLIFMTGSDDCGQTGCPFYPKHSCRQCNSCHHG